MAHQHLGRLTFVRGNREVPKYIRVFQGIAGFYLCAPGTSSGNYSFLKGDHTGNWKSDQLRTSFGVEQLATLIAAIEVVSLGESWQVMEKSVRCSFVASPLLSPSMLCLKVREH